jgi:hypothetical protein
MEHRQEPNGPERPAAINRFRRAQDDFEDASVEIDGARAVVKRVVNVTPLDRYARRGLLDRRQVEAGERLAADWYAARMEPCVVASYRDWVDCGTAADVQVDRAGARRRIARAIAAVGRIAASEVVAVCCDERAVGGTVAMEILRRGLDVLADHYGL